MRLLGGLTVEGVSERALGSRKARTLLKMLAVARGRAVAVGRICDVLWGDEQPARPADQVGVLVSRLRGVLGAERIRRTDAGYALAADWLDVDELEGLSDAAAKALEEQRVGAARAAAASALALIWGPLLGDDDGEWVERERAALAPLVTRARRLAVEAAVVSGDHAGAAVVGEQALVDDPYDEVVLRAVMSAHLAARRPASALAAYARVRERLAEDLGVPPTAETESLHTRALAAADGDLVDVASDPLSRGADIAMVGRERELVILDAALADAAAGGGALVVVEGDAGIGKTTLVETWSRRIEPDAVVLRGRCDELGRDLPLQPVADALADHLRAVGGERAPRLLGDAAPTLAPLLGPLSEASTTVVADAEAARGRLFAALVAVVTNAGESHPTVLVVEDLHMAGSSTLAWLAFARRRCRRTAIVVTRRPGGARALDATHHVALGPLGVDAVAELVGADRAAALHQRSGGHPLLLAALAASGDEHLPATVRDAVAARVDTLGSDVSATLRIAAVLGSDCDLDLVARVSDAPIIDVLTQMEAAATAGLVAERGNGFGFRHELVREALDAAIGAARRALVHREAARVLATRPDTDSLSIGIHARAGGENALAASAFIAAAAEAQRRSDLEAAEEHLAAAIDLAPTPEAYANRARVRMSRMALDDAAADAEHAISLGGGASALETAGWVSYYRRRYHDARAYAEEAAAAAEDAALRVSALSLAGRVRHGAGDLAGAAEQLTAVEDAPLHVRGVADVWLAQVRVHQGRPADALASLARPIVDPDSLAHPWAPLHLRFNRILALGQLARVTEALQVAADLDAAVLRAGAVGERFVAPAANAAAWILRWSGRGEEADERNWIAVEATGGARGPAADAMAEGHYAGVLDLADGALLRDDLDGATALAQRLAAVDSWNGTMAWHQRHRLGLLRARVALADDQHDRAAELAAAVVDDAASRGARRYELLARAIGGVADATVPPDALSSVVDGLGRCAALDGWTLVAALAASRHIDDWRKVAERRAAAAVAAAGDHADAARRFAERLLTSSSR